MVENRSDFDNPWKEAISLYFRPFMKFFFPQIEDSSLLKTLLREAIALGSVEQFLGYLQGIG